MAGDERWEGAPATSLFVLDGLTSLVEKSLLREEERRIVAVRDVANDPRVRRRATRMLSGEAEATASERHARWFLDLAERAVPEVFGWASRRGLAWFDAEIDNSARQPELGDRAG